jgi:flagellar motor switch protein FliN/FliY
MSPVTVDTVAELQDLAASALAAALPAGAAQPERAAEADPVPEGAIAVAATFVGARSADLLLVLVDGASLVEAAGGEGRVTATDVLRPALEAAAGPLGAGVVTEPREVPAAGALDGTTPDGRYLLRAGDRIVGWFVITIRSQSPAAAPNGVEHRLGRISNVAMDLAVQLGRVRMSVREVLSLEPGTVIELDRSVGSPADVLLNGRLIAHGEIVVVDQDYAVRITRILDTDGIG